MSDVDELNQKMKTLAEIKALREPYRTAPKNNRNINCFILLAACKRWGTNAELARTFGVARQTIGALTDVYSKYYKRIHNEFDVIGIKAFEQKYFDQELLNRLRSQIAKDRAKARIDAERGKPLWFRQPADGTRFEVWFDGGARQWFYAVNEPPEGRSACHYGPRSTYAEIVELMKRDESF